MGRPIDTHNTIVKMPDIAKVQSIQHQRDETQRRQFSLALQEEATQKETQVQTSHKTESSKVNERNKNKEKQKKKQKRSRGDSSDKQQKLNDEQGHIDLIID